MGLIPFRHASAGSFAGIHCGRLIPSPDELLREEITFSPLGRPGKRHGAVLHAMLTADDTTRSAGSQCPLRLETRPLGPKPGVARPADQLRPGRGRDALRPTSVPRVPTSVRPSQNHRGPFPLSLDYQADDRHGWSRRAILNIAGSGKFWPHGEPGNRSVSTTWQRQMQSPRWKCSNTCANANP